MRTDLNLVTADGMAAKDQIDRKENDMSSYPTKFCRRLTGKRSTRRVLRQSILSVSFAPFVLNSTGSLSSNENRRYPL